MTSPSNVRTVYEENSVEHGGILWQCFTYDGLNRLTAWKSVTNGPAGGDAWTLRTHAYDALGRLLSSEHSTGSSEHNPAPCAAGEGARAAAVDPQHTYSTRGQQLQNTDGANWGDLRRWADNPNGGPLHGPQPDTPAAAYNLGQAGGAGNPQRWTWENPTLPGDERNFWQQGHPQAKSGTGDGTKWDTGMTGSAGSGTGGPDVDSRLFFEGTVNPSDMDLATDDRQRGYMGIFGTNLNYAGSAPQVRNDELGVTLNPGGSKPDNAYLPGLEPPGWNDGLWQLMNVSNIPGQDPPGDWRDSHNKPMLAVGPGEPDPWADLPPFAQRPMVAFGPGEDNPYAGWSQLPMGAGAGTGADIGFLPGFDPGWFTGPRQPMGAGVDSAYLPGTEPPGWNAGARQLMGAGPSTCAAMPPGSESIMPASPDTSYSSKKDIQRRSEAEHKQDFMDHLYGRGSGVGSFCDPGGGGGGGGGAPGLITMTVGHGHPDIVLGHYYGDGPAGLDSSGAYGQAIGDRYGLNGWGGYMASMLYDSSGVEPNSSMANSVRGAGNVAEKVWENPYFQAGLAVALIVFPEFDIFAIALEGLAEGVELLNVGARLAARALEEGRIIAEEALSGWRLEVDAGVISSSGAMPFKLVREHVIYDLIKEEEGITKIYSGRSSAYRYSRRIGEHRTMKTPAGRKLGGNFVEEEVERFRGTFSDARRAEQRRIQQNIDLFGRENVINGRMEIGKFRRR